MDLKAGYHILDEKKLVVSFNRIANDWKKTKSHDFRYETFEHYMSKAALVCLINKRSKKGAQVGALSEYEFPNGRKVDVLQILAKNKEVVGYEIETNSDNNKRNANGINVLTVDLRKAPKEVHEAFKTLRKYFECFVV